MKARMLCPEASTHGEFTFIARRPYLRLPPFLALLGVFFGVLFDCFSCSVVESPGPLCSAADSVTVVAASVGCGSFPLFSSLSCSFALPCAAIFLIVPRTWAELIVRGSFWPQVFRRMFAAFSWCFKENWVAPSLCRFIARV